MDVQNAGRERLARFGGGGLGKAFKTFTGEQAVLADVLSCQQTAIDSRTQLSQEDPVTETLVHVKIVWVVNGRFGAQRTVLFEILLDPGVFIGHLQCGLHATLQQLGAELTGSVTAHLPAKRSVAPDPGPPISRFSRVTVQKNPVPPHGSGKHLCATDFHLPDGQTMVIACFSVFGGQRPRQTSYPLVEERLHQFGRQLVANRLQALRLTALQKAVIQGFKGQPGLLHLLLGPLMPVEIYLDRIGRICSDFDEGWPTSDPADRYNSVAQTLTVVRTGTARSSLGFLCVLSTPSSSPVPRQ